MSGYATRRAWLKLRVTSGGGGGGGVTRGPLFTNLHQTVVVGYADRLPVFL